MKVLYKPTGKIHDITPKQLDEWRKAGFNVEVVQVEEKPKAIKEREPKAEE